MMQIRNRSLLKMNQMIHARTLCILSGCFHHFRIDIISLNIYLDICIHKILCLFYRVIPQLFRNQIFPLLCGKLPVHSRCNICCNHGCLNRERSTSAKRIYQNTVLFPRCQHNQCCCQRLRQWSLAGHQTIASLVQGIPGSIQCNHYLIL